MLATGDYLWAFGDGGGQPNSISWLGNHPPYNFVFSTDVVSQDSKAVFVMLFGSFFGNWDDTDNIMRSFLGTPTMGLACCMAGEPHWFFHHMGLGETIGYGTRLTMNNSALYQNATNRFTRAVYIALMGDPTLRLDPIASPSALRAEAGANGVVLHWVGSSDSVLGYYVYRGPSLAGPFVRLTDSLVSQPTYTDSSPPPDSNAYMVRAVRLETTPSGSYFNASEGAFALVSAPATLPLDLRITRGLKGLTLTWNSVPGTAYRVLVGNSLLSADWADASGSLTATGTNVTWPDTNALTGDERFYRVVSP